MDIKTKIKQLMTALLNNIHERRKVILALSCLVVFFTTYLLILPAFTLDKEEASEQGGIDVPGVEQSVDNDEVAEEPAVNEPAKPAPKENKKSGVKKKSADITLENDESDDFSVAIESKGAVLSEDMSVAVREIDQSDKKQKKEYESLYNDALEAVQKAQEEEGLEKPSDFAFAKFYDISLMDGDTEVEPGSAVDVKISFSEELQKELKVTDPDKLHIVHFAVDKESGEVTPEVLDTESTDITVENKKVTEAAFTTDSFSVFAVVYTVDFQYEVNGEQYEFSMDGGGFITLKSVVEALKVDDNAEEFVANIEKAEFSNTELVWIGKADSETTVGELKKTNGLEPEYSAELTKEQIAETDAQTVKAGEWVLISMKPFTSKETMTVTMKNGDQFVVKVTDYQIKKTVISASGATYGITVTYGSDAQIPEGAELRVREISSEEEEYSEAHQEIKDTLKEGKENIPAHPVLFDIAIYHEGHEIEPAEGSEVQVEVKLADNALKGMYTDEDSPLLINDMPVTDDASQMEKQVQVLHLADDDQIDLVETEDTISERGITSSFTTDSFSNWLLYLDEDLTSIDVTTGDSITLRPYTEWVWKHSDEPTEPIDYRDGRWTFPPSDWTESRENDGYTYYTHRTNGSRFRTFQKTDSQLNETYTVVTSASLSATNGGFDLTTNKGKTIHVNVTQGQASGKPGTVNDAISGLTVNLFDYDVPYQKYQNGQNIPNTFDFTHSGSLDVQSNVASNPNSNNNINTNHYLKFLGYGGGNAGNNSQYYYNGINNYTQDDPKQGIVQNTLADNGFPTLEYGNHQNLGYLFDTSSKDHNVYAFPGADGLFQRDNQGYYYYNSNANYAEYDQDTKQFVLYKHTYSQNTGGSNGANAKPIGFFPFHEYDTGDTQPGMNFNGDLNHHFGMSMEVEFEIPKDRKAADDNGYKHDIIYEFSGDDDLWVFVDDKLVLDIGGIHQPVTGTINFTTGEIKVHGVDDKTTTFSVGPHTLKMFYIERGGCDSNLSVRFNLPLVIGRGNMRIAKKSMETDSANADSYLPGAVFGIWDNPNCEGDPYTVATSDRNGIVFKNLPIREEGQKYYLKEISPPEGYLLDSTIYTMTAAGKDSNGEYKFTISSNGSIIIEEDDTYGYPIIRNRLHQPIAVKVHKTWQSADGGTIDPENLPPDLTAKFVVKRFRTYSTDPFLTVNLKSNAANAEPFATISAYEGDVLTICYEHAPDSHGTTAYGTANGQQVLTLPTNATGSEISVNYEVNAQHAVNDEINIIIPQSFLDYCDGANYQGKNPEFDFIHSAEHNITREQDTGFNNNESAHEIELSAAGDWKGSLNNLTVQEKIDGVVYHYEYYVVEKDIPEGFEAIFLDSDGNPVADSTSQATTEDNTQEVINRELLDVPVEKQWADFSGEAYTWEATFQLDQMEVKVNSEDPDDPDALTTDFVPVDGKIMTIEKGQSPAPKFEDLPMYRVHDNGTVYRILYSVVEIGYSVKRNGTVVAQWGKNEAGETLVVIGDTRFEPQFDQDAGEHGSTIDDYVIKIVNVLQNRKLSKEIDLTVQKIWPEGSDYKSDSNAYATFALKRYVHEEHRDYHNVGVDAEWVTITLKTWENDDSKDQKVTVPKGNIVHIMGNILPKTNANQIAFSQEGGNQITFIQNNPSENALPFDIPVMADQDKTVTLTQGDNYVAGGRDGFRLSDYQTKGNDVPDTSFGIELEDGSHGELFTLNKAHNWSTVFEYLPLIEEQDIDPKTGAQTIYVFSYYLEELECNPADFYPVFKDGNDRIIGGDANNRIDYSTTLTAENKQKTTDITLKKVAIDKLDVENPPTLKNAAFRIEKYTSNTFQDKDESWGTNGEKVLIDINNNGVFSLEGLSTGFYKIVETAFPDGYIKMSEDPIFEVRLNSTTKELEVVLLNADATAATNNHTEMARVNDMTILFGNTPGAELPHAGGIGTTIFYIFGTILTLGSVVILVSRRRIQKNS
ncbi:MAG: fibro-slime domain-containing protein [Bacteroidales bacterium]|nr:fibro-slime domain-containing protein [Bacteroidales bacterium]